MQSSTRKRMPLWVLYIAVMLVFYLLSQLIPTSSDVPIYVTINDPGKATLDFLLETTKLITALNTALVGAAAAITVKGKDWSTNWSNLESTFVLLCFIGTSISYYGIYVSHIAILSMVYQGTINVYETQLAAGMKIQFYGMLAGVLCLGLVFTRMLQGRKSA
jgi:hypothetical protein